MRTFITITVASVLLQSCYTKKENFDAIVAGIGYYQNAAEIVRADKTRFEDLRSCVDKQKYFGKDGLYFCGFWIGPRGQIHEISLDAQKISKDIAEKERLVKK